MRCVSRIVDAGNPIVSFHDQKKVRKNRSHHPDGTCPPRAFSAVDSETNRHIAFYCSNQEPFSAETHFVSGTILFPRPLGIAASNCW
jgi:hypothetical protein